MPLFARLLLALGLVASTATAASAQPAEGRRYKVLGMQVEGGDLSAKDRDDLFRVVQAKLRSYPNIELLKPPAGELTDEMIDLECIDLDEECFTRLGKKYGAERVFYTQVDKAAPYALVVRVLEVSTGKLIRDNKVPVRSLPELTTALEREVEQVFGPPPAPKPETGTVVIESPGAKIYIGADYVGTGKVTLEKPPGPYTLRVTRDGYEEQVGAVMVEAGKTTTKKIELKPVGLAGGVVVPTEPRPDEPKAFYEQWWFWTGVGVVVLGTTVAIAAASDDASDVPRGSVVVSVDPQSAWQDAGVKGAAR